MPPSGLEVPPHAVARNPLPFQARDQIAWNLIEVPQKESERVARRLLHREHLNETVPDEQVIPVAFDGRIRDEVIEVRVVGESRSRNGVVVDKLPEEAECVALSEAAKTEFTRLDLERIGLVVESADRANELDFEQPDRLLVREPRPESLAWCLEHVVKVRGMS